MILIAIFSTIIVAYLGMVLVFVAALKKPARNPEATTELPGISLVIAMRNERENLPALLEDLGQLSYPGPWEVIMVDDHSEDGSYSYIRENKPEWLKVLQVPTGEEGKKAALQIALESARYDFVLQTDADCHLPSGWLLIMGKALMRSELVIGMVRMLPTDNFWSRFAALEFMSLQASGMAMSSLGQPIMGNGANLAYRKKTWREFHEEGSGHASGDDVFLIQAVHRHGGRITEAWCPESMVETAAPASFGDFLQQRLRWGGKTTAYSSVMARAVAVLISGVNLLLIAALACLFWVPQFWPLLLAGWGAKVVVDALLLFRFATLTAQRSLLKIYPAAALIYPFYISLAVLMILSGTTDWKGRKLSPLSGQRT